MSCFDFNVLAEPSSIRKITDSSVASGDEVIISRVFSIVEVIKISVC